MNILQLFNEKMLHLFSINSVQIRSWSLNFWRDLQPRSNSNPIKLVIH